MKIKKTKKSTRKTQQGFTLIEVALVLVLVSGVFLALYGIFGKTIANDDESFHEVVASNLAQEGVEEIRNQRDNNFLNEVNFDEGISSSENDICVDPTSNSYGICDGGNFLKSTPYKRNCDIEEVLSDEAIAVSCVVKWTGIAGIERKARAMAILTNWQK